MRLACNRSSPLCFPCFREVMLQSRVNQTSGTSSRISSSKVRPVRCSACCASEGKPPADSSFAILSMRHIGKNNVAKPINGSLCTTARTQSSNELRSRPRKNTPAAVISSSMPQHFSLGLCNTMRIGTPRLSPVAFCASLSIIVSTFAKQTSRKRTDMLCHV